MEDFVMLHIAQSYSSAFYSLYSRRNLENPLKSEFTESLVDYRRPGTLQEGYSCSLAVPEMN
jgi:hypothetical protein